MPRRSVGLALALLLSGCVPMVDANSWLADKYRSAMPTLFEPEATPRQPDPRPDVKAIVAGDLTAVFGHTNVRDVGVGPARPNGYGWLACVRADVTGIENRDIGIQYFVVEFDRGHVGLRRAATAADKCESERYAAT